MDETCIALKAKPGGGTKIYLLHKDSQMYILLIQSLYSEWEKKNTDSQVISLCAILSVMA